MLLTVQGMAIYHKSQFLAHFGPAWSILIQKIINYAWAQVQIHLQISIFLKSAWKYASNGIWHDYIPQKSILAHCGPFWSILVQKLINYPWRGHHRAYFAFPYHNKVPCANGFTVSEKKWVMGCILSSLCVNIPGVSTKVRCNTPAE